MEEILSEMLWSLGPVDATMLIIFAAFVVLAAIVVPIGIWYSRRERL